MCKILELWEDKNGQRPIGRNPDFFWQMAVGLWTPQHFYWVALENKTEHTRVIPSYFMISLFPLNISWTVALLDSEGCTAMFTASLRRMAGLTDILGTETAGRVRIRLFFRAWWNWKNVKCIIAFIITLSTVLTATTMCFIIYINGILVQLNSK